MIRMLAILALSLLASGAGQAKRTVDEIHLRGTVQDVIPLSHFSGKITPVDFDPRFALTLRVESVVPAVKNFPAGAVVAFAIHSPALLFDGEVKKGKTYDFSLQREIEQGKTTYFGLLVVKAPDQSGNRTSPVLGLHISGKRVYQDLRITSGLPVIRSVVLAAAISWGTSREFVTRIPAEQLQ